MTLTTKRMDLMVIMCCDKCEEKVKEEIQEVDGVQHVFTDQTRSSVVVYGYADSTEVVRKAKKVHRRAQLLQSVTTAASCSDQYYGHDHYAGYNSTPYRYERSRTSSDHNYHGSSSSIDNYSHGLPWSPHDYHQPSTYASTTRGGRGSMSEYQSSTYMPGPSYPSRYETDSSYSDCYDHTACRITNPNYMQLHARRYY
ncbi:hypothetical protein CY35_14G061600 [Sphagnum magellanicum]|nr:hypothetical protein CY35_14G061600 [Sphagnum magellanicum]